MKILGDELLILTNIKAIKKNACSECIKYMYILVYFIIYYHQMHTNITKFKLTKLMHTWTDRPNMAPLTVFT